MTREPELVKVGQLVLVRLLADGEGGATFGALQKDLDPLLEHRWSGGAQTELLEQALAHLAENDLVSRARKGRSDRVTLTPAGRQTALQTLGVTNLPPKTSWGKLKTGYLLALV